MVVRKVTWRKEVYPDRRKSRRSCRKSRGATLASKVSMLAQIQRPGYAGSEDHVTRIYT